MCQRVEEIEIVVLANSIKHGQHCVAGKHVHTHKWIRPVSSIKGDALSHEQARIQNRYGIFNVKPLQRARIGIAQHVPLPHQPENYLVDNTIWIQNYAIDTGQLNDLLDNPDVLWGEGNRVEYAEIIGGLHHITQSLYLVQVENLRLYTDNNRRRAAFVYEGINYDLAATDPLFDEIVWNNLPVLGILCVSLGEEYQGYCYKLVAKIF